MLVKKTDSIQQDKVVPSKDKFFTVPTDAPKQIKAVAQALERQNERHNYLSSIIKRAGYPRWDKAKVITLDSKRVGARAGSDSTGEIVYVPFVRDSQNYVNSILKVKLNASDTVYRMLYDRNYQKFGFDTTDHSKWNARDVFHVFTSFDYSVFGHTQFRVKDPRIFGRDSGILNAELVSGTGRSTAKVSTFVEVCTNYMVCESCAGSVARQAKTTIVFCCNPSYFSVCTTYDTEGGGGGGTYTVWTGSGDGTGGTGTGDGSGGSGGGWYGGGSDPCAGSGLLRTSTAIPDDGCSSGWEPADDIGSSYQYTSVEQESGLTDNDPNLIWWDENTTDPNTIYVQQQKPKWDNVYRNYPRKAADGDDLPAHDVCVLIGGEVLTQHNAGNANNGCALRTSRALNYSGVSIPKIQGQTWQGADGKNYFYRAEHLYNWMIKTFGQPDIHLTAADGAPDGTNFKDKLIGTQNRGIYIMKPKSQQSFGASGHATLWGGLDCIGGHNYFAAASDVYLWKLPQ